MSDRQRNFALICVAAGVGRRFGRDTPKAFVPLAGMPMYRHAIACFAARDDLLEVVVVGPDGHDVPDLDWPSHPRRPAPLCHTVVGGRQRTDSVRAGLDALQTACMWVAIHDAARPIITPDRVDAVLEVAYTHGAAIAATPVRDTLKQVADGTRIQRTVARAGLWQAQTPQVFRRDWIVEAYAHLVPGHDADVTDDAMLVERLGHPVHVVDATVENLKITYAADLALAEAILARRGPKRPNVP